jgi:ribosomal protein S18 acetylase RimI-like enzyme
MPHNDPHDDIRRKLEGRPDLFLVGVASSRTAEAEEEDGVVVATVMAGYEGHWGWLNYLAVAPGHQRRGIGRLMVAQAEERLLLAGCPKINLHIRASNAGVVAFYESLGFSADPVISMGKRL